MRKLASIRAIASIEPIEDADSIELVRIDGWQCVAKKGEFKPGDFCVYFEIDSILPKVSWSAFLGDKLRIKTRKMQGALSQGLALPTTIAPDAQLGDDVTELLKIEKYEPVLDSSLGGNIKGDFPSFIAKTDEERVQNCKKLLRELQGKPYTITVKLDGTSFTAFKLDGELRICSRNTELKESEGNAHWQIARELKLAESLPEGYAIQGELCGPRIQGNLLGLKANALYIFNIIKLEGQERASYADMEAMCLLNGWQCVPLEEQGESFNYTQEQLLSKAIGKYSSGKNREGLVIRSKDYKVSFKAISNAYLLKEQ